MPKVLVIFFFIISFFLPGEGGCFIPKLSYIYDELVDKNKFVNSYKIEQERTTYNEKYEEGKITLKERIFLKYPWKYARISTYDKKSRMLVSDGTGSLKVYNGKYIVPDSKIKMPLIYGFYLCKTKNELTSFLSKKLIRSSTTKLSRRNDHISILILGEKAYAGLWVDRQSFWPLAYSYGINKNTNASDFEYTFSSYDKITQEIYFPSKIKKYVRGKLVEQIKITKVVPNAKAPSNIFNISFLKKKYPRHMSESTEEPIVEE